MKSHLISPRSPLALLALACASISLSGCALATDEQADLENQDEMVAEAEQAVTTVPFPGSLTAVLGASTMSSYEPSGLALRSGVLGMASDNGKIARYNSSTNSWLTVLSGSNDFESLTVANNGQVLAGVEGTSSNSASIVEVSLTNGALGQSWKLNNVSGMEAMTFVPEAYTPFGPANTAGHPSAFDGYFFIATQNDLNRVSVYRLDQGSSSGTWIKDYPIDISLQTSDMCFANGVLYVLFDDHNTTDLLGVYVINTNPSNKILAFQKQYGLPTVYGSNANYEGITFDGQTIYLGRDNNSDPATNGVFKFANTIIYPGSVLPPLSW